MFLWWAAFLKRPLFIDLPLLKLYKCANGCFTNGCLGLAKVFGFFSVSIIFLMHAFHLEINCTELDEPF